MLDTTVLDRLPMSQPVLFPSTPIASANLPVINHFTEDGVGVQAPQFFQTPEDLEDDALDAEDEWDVADLSHREDTVPWEDDVND